MNRLLVSNIIDSIQQFPQVALFLALVTLGTGSVFAFADKTEFESHVKAANSHIVSLEKSVANLRFTVTSDAKHKEIFEIERIIDGGTAREIDHKRLAQLKKELKYAEMQYKAQLASIQSITK